MIDEFSELLTAKPDFIEMFVQIGRIGRSLGVHLLLAPQRLEEGRLRGLETYLCVPDRPADVLRRRVAWRWASPTRTNCRTCPVPAS